jgi:hypothetical protein
MFLMLQSQGAASGKKSLNLYYDGAVNLTQPGLVWQNYNDAGTGFVANGGVLWRDGGASFGNVTYPGAPGNVSISGTLAVTNNGNNIVNVNSNGYGGVYIAGIRAADFGIGLAFNNGAPGGHYWFMSSDGGGMAGAGNLTFYDNSAGATRFSLYPDGHARFFSTINSTNSSNGALVVDGGLGVGGAIFAGSDIHGQDLYASGPSNTGVVRFGTSNSTYLWFNSAAFILNNAPLQVNGGIASTSPSAGVGYTSGAGGTVPQAGSRANSVTINKVCGQITLAAAAGAAAWASFAVFNNTVAATDTVTVCQSGGGGNTYFTYVTNVQNGVFLIWFLAIVGTAVDTPVFNFTVTKGVNS